MDTTSFDPKTVIGVVFDSFTINLKPKDLILYALSIGCN